MSLENLSAAVQQKAFPITWDGHWIGGKWLSPGKGKQSKISLNPSTGEKLVEIQVDKGIVGLAIDAAYAARDATIEMPLAKRLKTIMFLAEVMADYRKSFIDILKIEAGKPHWEATEDVDAALRYLLDIAQRGEQIMADLAKPAGVSSAKGSLALLPVGVTLAYIPFSTPATSFAVYVSAALMTGCPLIVMPSAHASVTMMMFAHLLSKIEIPPGTVNIVFGNFSVFRQAIPDRRITAIIYTGSREHCEIIRQESRTFLGRELILQSGGKNAAVIHSSADLSHAIKCVTYGFMKSAGQLCTSTSRVFVYRSMLETFCEQLLATVQKLEVGPTDDIKSEKPGPFMGPLYSEKAIEKFLRFQTMGHREAKEALLWGKALEIDGGFFVSPGINLMNKFDNNSAYQSNVLFTPDLAIYTYDTLDEAIDWINTTDASFAVSFFGKKEVIENRRQRILAPNILIDLPTVEIDASLPLAGRLQSGHHRYNGPGIALFLAYPQIITSDSNEHKVLDRWHWPA